MPECRFNLQYELAVLGAYNLQHLENRAAMKRTAKTYKEIVAMQPRTKSQEGAIRRLHRRAKALNDINTGNGKVLITMKECLDRIPPDDYGFRKGKEQFKKNTDSILSRLKSGKNCLIADMAKYSAEFSDTPLVEDVPLKPVGMEY